MMILILSKSLVVDLFLKWGMKKIILTISRKRFLWREGAREADRLLEEHKGAEAEAKKLKTGMDSSVCSSVGDGGVHCSAGEKKSMFWYLPIKNHSFELNEFQVEKLTKARDRWAKTKPLHCDEAWKYFAKAWKYPAKFFWIFCQGMKISAKFWIFCCGMKVTLLAFKIFCRGMQISWPAFQIFCQGKKNPGRYEKRVGEAELAEARLGKAEPAKRRTLEGTRKRQKILV